MRGILSKLVLFLTVLCPLAIEAQTRINPNQISGMTGVTTLPANATIPAVGTSLNVQTNNNLPTTISNFTGGYIGQKITLNCGDANTSILNNANFSLASSFNCSGVNQNTITLSFNGTQWVEIARTPSGGVSPSGNVGDLQANLNSVSLQAAHINDGGTLGGTLLSTEPNVYVGPTPYIDAQAYGHLSSNNTITVTTTGGSNSVTSTGVSDFVKGIGIVIAKAGPATSVSTPAAPSVTVNGVTGNQSFSYECRAADAYEGQSANGAATTVNNAPNIFGAFPVTISSISRSSNVVTANLSSAVNLTATNEHVLIVNVSGGTTSFNGLFLLTNGTGSTSALTFAQTGANESGTVSGTSTAQLRNAAVITAISRATNGTITVTTDVAMPWTNLSYSNYIQIWGVQPSDLDGWYATSSVSGTTITIPTALKVAATETGSLAAAGSNLGYSFNNVMGINNFENINVTCPVLSGTTAFYYIYANYGSGYSLIGATARGNGFGDFGPFWENGYAAPLAASVPTTPSASAQNQMFVGSIASINGTTLTLNQNVNTSVSGVTAYHDDSLNVAAAANASGVTGMMVNFGPSGGPYIFNAPLILNNGFGSGNYAFNFENQMVFNEPLVAQSQDLEIKTAINGPNWLGGINYYNQVTGRANPMIFATNGAHIYNQAFTATEPNQVALQLPGIAAEVCNDRFVQFSATDAMVILGGGFQAHVCNVEWQGAVQLPNSAGAPLPGEPNFLIPVGIFVVVNTGLVMDGNNYGGGSGIQLFSPSQGSSIKVDGVQTFQSPWTPLVFITAPSLINNLEVGHSTMDSNWNPGVSNLGCTTCSYITTNGVLTTGGVPTFTGLPAQSGMTSLNPLQANGWSQNYGIGYCGATSGTTQSCANANITVPIVVWGDVQLNTATSQSITTLPFTDALYSCSGSDLTTAAGLVSFNTYAAASVTIQETGGANTDHLRYTCTGH